MTILTDEIVEKAARAINPYCWDDAPGANILCDAARVSALKEARAALTAALPGLIEACAKVAERKRAIVVHKGETMTIVGNRIMDEIAANIRAFLSHSSIKG